MPSAPAAPPGAPPAGAPAGRAPGSPAGAPFDPALAALVAEYQAAHAGDAPLMVLAPTQRCGSTLLQRALNATERAVVYGENFYLVEMRPPQLMVPLDAFDRKRRFTALTAQRFFQGGADIDATALFPDFDAYGRLLLGDFYGLLRFYRQDAEKRGRSGWGLKHQLRRAVDFELFRRFAPPFRSIIVHRDLADVAKSFKARWPQQLSTPEQLHALGRRWADNLAYLLEMPGETLALRYETMVAEPERTIAQIEAFCGVPVSRAAFDVRVNAELGAAKLQRADGGAGEYIPPAELDPDALARVRAPAAAMLERLGYPR